MSEAANMYRWRKLAADERGKLLTWRQYCKYPWHRPPHLGEGPGCYHLTAACYEHAPLIGASLQRLGDFSNALLAIFAETAATVHAWCVLPNHYHVHAMVPDLQNCLSALGRLHGRTSHAWNGEDYSRGRKVWSPAADRAMRSEAHFWSTVNYIHHHPVRHGYVEKWQDWPFSSVHAFLEVMGRDEAESLWSRYPLKNYGAGWDEPTM